MRFKAQCGSDTLQLLWGITQTLSKLSQTSALYLNEEFLRIALVPDNLDCPRGFVELNALSVFTEYRIESQSDNVILFELNLDHFSKALMSGKSSPLSQLKLAKRNGSPCLCFEAKAVEGLAVDIIHDIPIKMLKASEIVYYMPPEVPPPSVCLELPKNKLMRTILERMGRMSRYVEVETSQSGKLYLRVDHGTASTETLFNGLVPRYEGALDPAVHSGNKARVALEIKKLSLMLNVGHLPISHTVLFISDNQPLVIHVQFHPADVGSMTFYSPVLTSDEDEVE